MTKKLNTTLLLAGVAVAAAAAVGAAVLMRPDPLAGYGTDLGTPGHPIPNPSGFWDLTPDFGVHNTLVSGYGSVWDRWVNSIAPVMPLAPRTGGLYGERFSDRYTYDTPADTGAAPTTSSGFTPSGTTGSSSGSFGVSAGSLYGRGN